MFNFYPPPIFFRFCLIILLVSGCISCNKTIETSAVKSNTSTVQTPANFFAEAKVPGIQYAVSPTSFTNKADSTDPNNGDTPVQLYQQLTNPYTISNMQTAYYNLYARNITLTANTLYVKFTPANTDQLETLNNVPDLELQDYPMDYELRQDGDYYQDPAIGTETIPSLYAAVPAGFTAPTGIAYTVISNLYVPADNLDWEEMAESMAAGGTYTTTTNSNGEATTTRTDVQPNVVYTRYPPPCPGGPDDPCGGGGGGGGTPPPNTPPPSTPNPTIPNGGITVQEIKSCNIASANVPVRQARIVCKRWFKVWRGYTNDLGKFTCTKKFRNKVKVILKTENDNATIAKVRGVRLWQILFPIKKILGVYDKDAMANISYVFPKPIGANAHNKELAYWAGVTAHNSVVEFRQYSTEFGTPQPPQRLKILVSNWGFNRDVASAPMFHKCHASSVAAVYITYFVASSSYITAGFTLLGTILKNHVDIIVGYASDDYTCEQTSAAFKETVYHEVGHAQHFGQVGCDFWTSYCNAIITELSKTNQTGVHPYGNGTDASTAPIIATGEMWGNHCGYIYSNRYWGDGGSSLFTAFMQGNTYNNNSVPTLTPYLAAIENFNPALASDVHRWIPEGLPYDLMDNNNDRLTINNVRPDDKVTGYTNSQMFNALQSDVRSIIGFRSRLLQQNNNNQSADVITLFGSYAY